MCYYVYHYVCTVSLCVFACISTCTLCILKEEILSAHKLKEKKLYTQTKRRDTGLAKFDWKVVAHWATKYSNLVAQQ